MDGDYVIVRSGLVGIDFVALPAYKMQRIALRESFLSRRRGLASISFLVASRALTVPLLERKIAVDVVNYCAYQVEVTDRSWM